jgi:hypothetical protein
MVARNDITGDLIKSKTTMGKEFEDRFKAIFGDKKKTNGGWTPPVAPVEATTNKPVEPVQLELDFGDEHRIDTIGQNGNDGLHYDK